MIPECHIDEILNEYNFDSDEHSIIESGIQRRIDEMRNETLKNKYDEIPNLGSKLILWNMCSFPEFYRKNNEIKIKECFASIDPNPISVKYNLEQKSKGLKPIPSHLHGEVDLIVDFISEVMIHSRFYREMTDENLKKSARAFFPDNPPAPYFRVNDYVSKIEEEIDSLSDKLVVDCRFPDSKLPENTISDLVRESLMTYFARLEYNANINSIIVDKTNEMVAKLYQKELNSATDIERIVSQIFVAHDWIRDEKEDWLKSDERRVKIKGRDIALSDYLNAGEQSLLFEIVPTYIKESSDLKGFFGGKTYRIISEDADMQECNDVQIADFGEEMELFSKTNYNEYNALAKTLRDDLTIYRKRRPTMFVRKKRYEQ